MTGGTENLGGEELAGFLVGPWPSYVPLFRIVGQLGTRGAEGTTYKAERLRREGSDYVATGELIALKSFEGDAFWRDGEDRSRTLQERLQDLEEIAATIARIPGIVAFRSPFEGHAPLPPGVTPDDSAPRLRMYLPMQLLDGPDLQAAIDSASSHEQRTALLARFADLAEALHEMVRARPDAPLAHRDIKPHNLILTTHADGRPGMTLVDLGLLVSPRRSVTAGVGSIGFMSPEQQDNARISPQLAHRVDWHAFYATVAATLTGSSPPLRAGAYEAWLTRFPEILPRTRQMLVDAVTAPADRRPEPWVWLPALLSTLGDSRGLGWRAGFRRHQRPLGRVTALALVGLLAAAAAIQVMHLRQPSTGSKAAAPITIDKYTWLAGCDGTTQVAMPDGVGDVSDTRRFPQNRAFIASILQASGGAWYHGELFISLTNGTSETQYVGDIKYHKSRVLDTSGPPLWIYSPTAAECTPSPTGATRRYRIRLDRSEIEDATGATPTHVRPFLIPAHSTVVIEIDTTICGSNLKWDLDVYPAGATRPLRVANLISFGRALGTGVYSSTGGRPDNRQRSTSTLNGSDPRCNNPRSTNPPLAEPGESAQRT